MGRGGEGKWKKPSAGCGGGVRRRGGVRWRGELCARAGGERENAARSREQRSRPRSAGVALRGRPGRVAFPPPAPPLPWSGRASKVVGGNFSSLSLKGEGLGGGRASDLPPHTTRCPPGRWAPSQQFPHGPRGCPFPRTHTHPWSVFLPPFPPPALWARVSVSTPGPGRPLFLRPTDKELGSPRPADGHRQLIGPFFWLSGPPGRRDARPRWGKFAPVSPPPSCFPPFFVSSPPPSRGCLTLHRTPQMLKLPLDESFASSR